MRNGPRLGRRPPAYPCGRGVAAGLALMALAATVTLAACGPTFAQRVAVVCGDSTTAAAYANCRRSLERQLAEERLGYIVRSEGQRRTVPATAGTPADADEVTRPPTGLARPA